MVIYMDQYRKAKAANIAANVAMARCYEEEKLCVNWNPAIGVIAMSFYQNMNELSPQLPEDFSEVDIDALLERVSALATQI